MDTRKLRALHLAYLRGNSNLIRADYPHGIRSVLRENMILHALAMQDSADQGRVVQQAVTALYAPYQDVKKLKQTAKGILDELWRLYHVGRLNVSEARRRRATGSVDGIVKIYHALEKSSFFDMIREQHFCINPSERPRAT